MITLKEKRRQGWKRLWLLLFLPAALALWAAARFLPGFADSYCQNVYRPLAGALGTATGALPFSLAELALAGLAAAVIYVLARAAARAHKDRERAAWHWLRAGAALAGAASALLFVFVALCGVSYQREGFAKYCGLEVRESSTAELKALCAELIKDANALADSVERNERGEAVFSGSDRETAARARELYALLAERYPVLAMGGESFGTPKPLLISPLMSYTQISGFMFPFTMEANVNVDGPDFLIPATMMHERTHLAGFMREDEANFAAFLACRESGDPLFGYSGAALALLHSMNALYAADPQGAMQLRKFYCEGLDADMSAQNAYLSAHEGAVAEVSDAVNDAYLKVNDQQDGVKSYGRMVDLLLADYRARHG